MKYCYFLLFTLVFLALIPTVYADDPVNLSDLPQQLATQLTIPLFAGQILASSIILALFLLPTVFACSKFGKDVIFPSLFMGFLSLSFCIAVGWLPTWILLITVLIVVALLSGQLRNWVGGRE